MHVFFFRFGYRPAAGRSSRLVLYRTLRANYFLSVELLAADGDEARERIV